MENELKKYIERMNKYNQWEEEYRLQNPYTEKQKIRQYLELMDLAYKTVPQKRIEKIYKEKLERLIKEKKMLIEGYKKYLEKIS
jgi:hypothetical protein